MVICWFEIQEEGGSGDGDLAQNGCDLNSIRSGDGTGSIRFVGFFHSVQGASAAVNAIVLLYIFLNPKGRIYLYFVIPVPAALVGAAWIGLDLLRAREGERRASGFFQFGGTLVAALAWARIRKRWI